MSLPKFSTEDKDFNLMQSSWATSLDPVIALPPNQGFLIKDIELKNGTPTIINHKLGRKLQGWLVSDISEPVTIYRSEPKNALTLTLVASAAATCDIWVF